MSAHSTMAYIRRTYGVPAEVGQRVKFQGKPGRIVGASPSAPYLRIRLDGDKRTLPPLIVHPTWQMEYEKGGE